MTGAAHLQAPPPGVTGWVVSIDMPRFEKGKHRGELVGWLSANTTASTKWGRIEQTEIRRLWRQAAWKQYERLRLPKNLGRIFVLVQFQFVDHTKRDSPNYELTVKPCIDALQPDRVDVRKKKNRAGGYTLTTVHHLGWGVVPDDNDEWVVRGPQQPKLEPLGRGNPVGGRVVLHIFPFPKPLTSE